MHGISFEANVKLISRMINVDASLLALGHSMIKPNALRDAGL